jgi:hypothetical protein
MIPFYPWADVNVISSFVIFASAMDVREMIVAGFTSLSSSSSEDEPEEEERLNVEFWQAHQCTSSSGGRGGSTAALSNCNNSFVSVSHDPPAPAGCANANPAPCNTPQQIRQLGSFLNADKAAI